MNSTRLLRLFSTRLSLFAGDGIGPEVANSVVSIFDAAQVPVTWEPMDLLEFYKGAALDAEGVQRIKANKIGLKGPYTTPISEGHVSLNILLRKSLELYANVRPCKSIPGVKTPYSGVDVVTIRENTEGEYSGKEHEVVPGVIENLKIISEKACRRISKFAFEYASTHKRHKVHAVHKASIMKLGDGLFLRITREIANNYREIQYFEKSVDTVCGILASNPATYDVMVMPNLYGDIVSDVCAGLIGGLGLTGSANIGDETAIFEAVHGSALDIAGKNLANPTALLLSSIMMLRHLELTDLANKIETACFKVLGVGTTLTKDLGGSASTSDFTRAIISELK